MATGFAEKLDGRMIDAEAAVRAALAAGDSRRAFHVARGVYGSEAAKLRQRRPDDGALTDAEMAASLLAAAEGMRAYKPVRAGRRGSKPPAPRLLATFERVLARERP
jgi:hypothetical protein